MAGSAVIQTGLQDVSLTKRFLGKVLIDVLPAAATSLAGAILMTQYQVHHTAVPRPQAAQSAPASAEMLQLVRDEHTAIMSYLNTQLAAEKSRYASDDAAKARALATAETGPEPAELREVAQSLAASKPGKRLKVAEAGAAPVPVHAPLVIAQTGVGANAAPTVAPAPKAKSLLEQGLDLKDHVVAATGNAAWSVVSAIGGIPSWIATIGDRRSDLTPS